MSVYFDGEEQSAEMTRGDECDVPGWSDTYYFTKSVSAPSVCPDNNITCEVWLDTYQCDEYDTTVRRTDGDWSVICREPDDTNARNAQFDGKLSDGKVLQGLEIRRPTNRNDGSNN